MTTIHLYLGAHKTASTHIQGIFLANRETLARNGVALSAPQDIRKTWLPRFFKYCNHQKENQDKDELQSLQSLLPDCGRWILSEENIIGTSFDLSVMPGIYPLAENRIRAIISLFPQCKVKLFFSLRSYDTFYRSAYTEVVRNRGFLKFSRFYDEERFKDNSWLNTVAGFARALPQENITLWRFEEVRQLMPDVVQRITGIADSKSLMDAYNPETTRPSLSAKTIKILNMLHPVLNKKESLALVERINNAYSIDKGHPAYEPFTKEQADAFKLQYEQDWIAIRNIYPNINIMQA